MNNKMKKRTITGVAIISGAILFSVGVAGTVHLINENNEKDKNNYLKLVLKSNDRSQRELDSMMNKGFIEVTYLCLKTYINL